jgi:hypothetical protein
MTTRFTAYYTISKLCYYHGDCMLFKPICYPTHTWYIQNIPGITLILVNTKHNYLSYISSKIFLLCNYALLSAIVKVLETFLEAIF